ncbi:hypothetical protein J3A83DRAFT_2523442 [Scleroderma citrinum]
MPPFKDLWRKFVKSKETTEILPTDTVVFIVGPTGSGKTWLLRELVKSENFHLNKQNLKPSTKQVNAVRCHFSEKGGNRDDIVIVDTPSFYTFDEPDGEATLKRWMNENHTKSCKQAGILYMHNIAANPQDGNLSVCRHLDAFGRVYPWGVVSCKVVIPTIDRGARYTFDKTQGLISKLKAEAEKVNATTCDLFDGKPETAWEMVQELLKQMDA